LTRLLVLRPEPGASATVERALALGLDAIAVPFFEVEPVDWQAPDTVSYDGLLLTSANAIRHGGDQLQPLRRLRVYAVGDATADAARTAGFDVAATGTFGIDSILGSLPRQVRLLHLCGAERRTPMAGPQNITTVVVYRSRPTPSPDLSAAVGSVALIHSPRAGRRFAELIGDRASIVIAAISPAAAAAVGEGWKSVEAADQPSDEALLALAARLCNKPQPK
jgi:uroporphyrinogen-III synthase